MERKLYYEALVQDKKLEITAFSMTFKRTHAATFVVEKKMQTAGICKTIGHCLIMTCFPHLYVGWLPHEEVGQLF